MRHIILIFTLFPFLLIGQTAEQFARAEKIKEYYSKSISSKDSLKYQKQFFENFPSSFNDFNAIFGWFDSENTKNAHGGPLYDGQEEIFYFFQLKCIGENEFYQKIINLALGGHWEADAINYFQNGLQNKIFANPTLTFDLLNAKSDSEIISFFFFFFHGIHPKFTRIPDKLLSMESYNIRIYKLMKRGFDEAISKSGH